MNIFITDCLPQKSAEALCDQHIRGKMILESVQMLSTCLRYYYREDEHIEFFDSVGIYKAGKSHANHCCNLWIRESVFNFHWLIAHVDFMEDIRLKYGFNPHKSMEVLSKIREFIWKDRVDLHSRFPQNTRPTYTYPFLAMDEDLQKEYGYIAIPKKTKAHKDVYRANSWMDACAAYRSYIPGKVFKDGQVPTWTINPVPEWLEYTYTVR